MGSFDLSPLLQVFGAIFIVAGIAAVSGRWKSWYWYSQRAMYAYLPMGVLFLLVSFEREIGALSMTLLWIARACYILLLGLAAWVYARPPAWIKPAWIRKIEAQPHTTYAAMARIAKTNQTWHEHVETPEALDRWINALQRQAKEKKKK